MSHFFFFHKSTKRVEIEILSKSQIETNKSYIAINLFNIYWVISGNSFEFIYWRKQQQ